MAKDASSGNRGAPRGDRRTFTTLKLAQLVPGLTRAAYRRRSPAGALLMSEWSSIVGERLAAQTEPRRLAGTQLTIACTGPMAMELAHVSGKLIERINVHAGRRLVERLRFVQDFKPPAPPTPALPTPPALHGAAAPAERIEGVEEGPLGDALAALQAALRRRAQK